jgi:hypothetical protein
MGSGENSFVVVGHGAVGGDSGRVTCHVSVTHEIGWLSNFFIWKKRKEPGLEVVVIDLCYPIVPFHAGCGMPWQCASVTTN